MPFLRKTDITSTEADTSPAADSSPSTAPEPKERPKPLPIMQYTFAWPGTLANFGITAGIFGGSILFSVIISQVPPVPPGARFSDYTVRVFLAASWFCWLLVMGIGALISLMYTDEMMTLLFRGRWFTDKPQRVRQIENFISLLVLAGTYTLMICALAAWVLMGLAVIAYIPWTGWLVVAGAGYLIVIVLVCYGAFVIALCISLFGREGSKVRKSRIAHIFILNDEDRAGLPASG